MVDEIKPFGAKREQKPFLWFKEDLSMKFKVQSVSHSVNRSVNSPVQRQCLYYIFRDEQVCISLFFLMRQIFHSMFPGIGGQVEG